VLVIARQLLLVDAAVRLPVSTREPAQAVRLFELLELVESFRVGAFGHVHEAVQHFTLCSGEKKRVLG